MIGFSQVKTTSCVNEIGVVQNRAAILQIDHIVGNRALRTELPKNQVSYPEVRSGDRYFSVRYLLFPFDLPGHLQWPAHSVRRIGGPKIACFRRIQGNLDLRWLRRSLAGIFWKPVSPVNIQFVLISTQTYA